MSSISISPAASRCVGAGPAGGRAGPRTHACVRTLPFCGGSFPLSAVTSARLPQVTFAPRDHLRTGAKHPCPQQLAQPRTTRDHQQGNGSVVAGGAGVMVVVVVPQATTSRRCCYEA